MNIPQPVHWKPVFENFTERLITACNPGKVNYFDTPLQKRQSEVRLDRNGNVIVSSNPEGFAHSRLLHEIRINDKNRGNRKS